MRLTWWNESTRTSIVWSCCFSLSFLLLNEEVLGGVWLLMDKKAMRRSDFGLWQNLRSIFFCRWLCSETAVKLMRNGSPALHTLAALRQNSSIHFTDMRTSQCTHFCWTACAHVSFTVALPSSPEAVGLYRPPEGEGGEECAGLFLGEFTGRRLQGSWTRGGSGGAMPVDALCWRASASVAFSAARSHLFLQKKSVASHFVRV